ncbi:MAG: DMT family transporter [bacterium]|nr:DMT family transporter [bacterium]
MEELNDKTLRLSKHRLAVVALIVANIIWGAASPIFKWSLQDIQPFTLAFLRFFLAALIILPFTLHQLHVKRQDWGKLALMSFFGITINISFFFVALQITASVNAPIIGSAGPVFIILGSLLFLKEKLKKIVLIGTLVSLIGVVAIVAQPLIEKGLDASFIGNLFLIVAVLGGVGHTLLLRRMTRNYSSLTITFWTFALGSVTFIPMMYREVQRGGFLTGVGMQGFIGIVFGALLCSALAYYLFAIALKYVVASESSVFTYMDPIVAIAIAVPLLGEKITPIFTIGSLLVFTGIFIAEKRINWHPIHLLFNHQKRPHDYASPPV